MHNKYKALFAAALAVLPATTNNKSGDHTKITISSALANSIQADPATAIQNDPAMVISTAGRVLTGKQGNSCDFTLQQKGKPIAQAHINIYPSDSNATFTSPYLKGFEVVPENPDGPIDSVERGNFVNQSPADNKIANLGRNLIGKCKATLGL